MTQRITPDDLLQRYIHEIGSRLPSKDQKDVMDELESLLTDTIEERSQESDGEQNTALVCQVLQDFGPPEEVAARYRGKPNYLIGPDLYPAFIRTLKLVFLIAGIITLVLVSISTLSQVRAGASAADISALAIWFDVFWNFAWSTFGIAVVVFAVIERNWVPPVRQEASWNPQDLPAINDPNRVSLVHTTFRIYGIVVLFLLFNVFVDRLGIFFFDTTQAPRMITLSELGVSFPIYLLNLWWVIALARNVFLLYRRSENRLTRWCEFGLGVYGAGVLYLILQDVSLAVDRDAFIKAIGNADLAHIAGNAALISLGVALLITVITSAKRLYLLLRSEFRATTD
jgi:hypothetical protein